jgi:type I restriction enzyme S subunit
MKVEKIPFADLLCNVVDNRGKSCPTTDTGIPLIATNCIRNELLYPTYEKARFISQEIYATWFRGHPKPGDIIFVNKATPGRVCLVPDPVDFCIAQDMVAIRADEKKVHPKFLLALLRSPAVQARIEQMHVGTLIPHFKKGDFDKLLLSIPEREVQEFIGDLYFEFSSKIDFNRRMNETLEALAQTIFKSWFVESTATKLPKGWRAGKLGEVAENPRRSIQPDAIESSMAYIGLEHMPRRSIALSDWESDTKLGSNKLEFKRGEILFGKLRPYFHKVGVAPLDGVCSTDILVVRPKTPEWFGFVLGYVSSVELVNHTDAASTGTKMPRTNWNDIARFEVALPPESLTAEFTATIRPMIERIIANIHESRTLAESRDALLPKLLSGELRVPTVSGKMSTAN